MWLWPVAFVLIAGWIGIWLLQGDESEATLTFDGTTATYRGAEVLQAGDVWFTLENNSDVVADFLWGRHTEDGVTFEELTNWVETNSDSPPWFGEIFRVADDLAPRTTAVKLSVMSPGTYALIVWEVEARQAHAAALVTVTDE